MKITWLDVCKAIFALIIVATLQLMWLSIIEDSMFCTAFVAILPICTLPWLGRYIDARQEA